MTLKQGLRAGLRNVKYLADASRPTLKPRLVVYGNCQAAALRKTIEANGALNEFAIVAAPPAHEITSHQIPAMRALLKKTEVFVTQQIRSDYRSLPIGAAQLAELLPADAKIITYPSMYYRGLHPFLAYVHASGPLGTPAPITGGYHDIRFIYAAALGLTDEMALDWLTEFAAPREFVLGTAEQSLDSLREREVALDVSVSGAINALAESSFWTLNHPSNAVVRHAADQVQQTLGLPANIHRNLSEELLSSVLAPTQIDVTVALGYPPARNQDWVVNGVRYSEADVLRSHLTFYRANPEIVRRAVAEHRLTFQFAGLGRAVEIQ